MDDVASVDFFTEPGLIDNPYPYFDEMRRCPVQHAVRPGMVSITGYDEAVEVYRDHDAFSSCNAASGPFPGLPEQAEGDDISDLIAKYRDQLPMSDFVVTLDGDKHTAERALLRKLLTPTRLKDDEARIKQLADRQIDEFIAEGKFEVNRQYSNIFSLLVVADLLGVPDSDREEFRKELGSEAPLPHDQSATVSNNPLEFLFARFYELLTERREAPRDDMLTELALATYPDGTTPELAVVVRLAGFLFAAGGDTTARLIASAMRILAENPEYQDQLRGDKRKIADFVEETLRTESPTKSDFRLARKTTTVAGVTIPAGTTILMHPGAANRDPRKFPEPNEFKLGRDNVREHIAFGRGAHSCPGGPLARAEATISIERFLDRMSNIRISEAEHGPAGSRHYDYEQTFLLRGLTKLHLTFTPRG
jgi:cytochrome P450